MIKRLFIASFLLASLIKGSPSHAEVLAGRKETLRLVYGAHCQFSPCPVTLTAEEASLLEKKLGSRLLSRYCDLVEIRCGGRLEGHALIDEELGKHQPITFLVAMDAGNRIKRVEVLVYRERYGSGVKSPRFTGQFTHKSSSDPMRIGKDLDAVSGATISSKALSLGARKAVALAEHFYSKKSFQ